ncbi:AEC family transporter [Marivivens aquimaris]|uniref:AEC family transporter n=1 Tax=Marivivens aquimaris TaxID=2774876 RepID=UPI0018811578|nr:AEC family transporter [Marivivens aquimaris]
MNLALTVLEITAPVFILAAIGFGWVRLGFEYRVEFVTRLAMTLSVPCLIFTALMRTEINPEALAALSLAAFVGYGIIAAASLLLVTVMRADRQTYLAPLIFGNTGNLGLPLALFAFGETGLGYAVVVFAVMAILSFTVGIWLVSGSGSLTKIIKEPIVAATMLGALFLWQGWHTPKFLTNSLELIGQMAIPIMLITLGVAVARLETRAIGKAMLMAVIKIAVCVGAGVIAGQWFDLEPVAMSVLIVQLATPVAVTSYMLAEKYGADSQAVAGLVVVSTVMSVVGLPLILAFLV